jgi:ABC-type microcin C transport system duplicated ATPase subunit YejF
VALVGESGSGKSVTALSVLKLLPYPAARHPSGSIRFKGRELLNLPEDEIRHVRGNDITIIFQEPMTSLSIRSIPSRSSSPRSCCCTGDWPERRRARASSSC